MRRESGTAQHVEAPGESGFAKGHVRTAQSLHVSSVGFGTRPGAADAPTDALYRAAIDEALARGCTLFDTAPEYREGRSQVVLGECLSAASREGRLFGDAVVCTRGGTVGPDEGPLLQAAPEDTLVDEGGVRHCLWPGFLEASIERARDRLGRDVIDVYYLEALEPHLRARGPKALSVRLPAALETLERARQRGLIRYFGVSSTQGLLAEPRDQDYLDLGSLVALARDVGGDEHGFRFAQAPYSILRPTAVTARSQTVDGSSRSLVQAAAELGLSFVAAESLAGGRAVEEEPGWISGVLASDVTRPQAAIQFVRSTPGVVAALVGATHPRHVAEDFALARMPQIPSSRFEELIPPEAPQVPWLFGNHRSNESSR